MVTRERVRAALFLLLLAALIVVARQGGEHVAEFGEWVRARGSVGVAVFIGGYAIATVAAMPGSILTLAAGAIFGIGEGTLYVFIGAVLGSSLAFLISRYAARPLVARWIRKDVRFERIDRAVGEEGWKIVFLLRLSPLIPYNALNYALGLTRVSFRDYVVGAIGMLPGTLLYVYSGNLAGELIVLVGGGEVQRTPLHYTVLALGLAATIAVTVWIGRIARRALAEGSDLPVAG